MSRRLFLSRWQMRTLDLLSLHTSLWPVTSDASWDLQGRINSQICIALCPAWGVSSQHYVNFTAYILNLECYLCRPLHRVLVFLLRLPRNVSVLQNTRPGTHFMTLLVRFGWEQENNSVNRGQLPVSDMTKCPRKHLVTSSGNTLSLSLSFYTLFWNCWSFMRCMGRLFVCEHVSTKLHMLMAFSHPKKYKNQLHNHKQMWCFSS